MIRALIAERVDPVLFALSYDYVGDLSETVALMWPADPSRKPNKPPTLTEVVETLSHARQGATAGTGRALARRARRNRAAGRCSSSSPASLRIGVSARLAKTAAASLGDKEPDEIEVLWPGLTPPYLELFAWLEGRGDKPVSSDPAPFRPAMLAHAIEEPELAALDASRLHGGMEMGRHPRAGGERAMPMARPSRGSIRAPATTSRKAFPT